VKELKLDYIERTKRTRRTEGVMARRRRGEGRTGERGGGRKGERRSVERTRGTMAVGENLSFREKLGFENLAFRGKLGFENLAFRENGVDFRVET
jgi:hypothetical protein